MVNQRKTVDGGLVIIFEGLDGVGKTTQIIRAKEYLEQKGWSVYVTRNLGGSAIGEELRKVILSPLPRPALTDLYIGAAVQEALAEDIEKKRKEGQIILIDRGPMSFAAYTSYGGDLDKKTAWKYADAGHKKFKPNLTIFYTLEIKKALKQLDTRKEARNYFENKPLDFFKKVLRGLEEGAKRYQAVPIDADGSIGEVHEATIEQIEKLLPH